MAQRACIGRQPPPALARTHARRNPRGRRELPVSAPAVCSAHSAVDQRGPSPEHRRSALALPGVCRWLRRRHDAPAGRARQAPCSPGSARPQSRNSHPLMSLQEPRVRHRMLRHHWAYPAGWRGLAGANYIRIRRVRADLRSRRVAGSAAVEHIAPPKQRFEKPQVKTAFAGSGAAFW
jgi:hypothetical protein